MFVKTYAESDPNENPIADDGNNGIVELSGSDAEQDFVVQSAISVNRVVGEVCGFSLPNVIPHNTGRRRAGRWLWSKLHIGPGCWRNPRVLAPLPVTRFPLRPNPALVRDIRVSSASGTGWWNLTDCHRYRGRLRVSGGGLPENVGSRGIGGSPGSGVR